MRDKITIALDMMSGDLGVASSVPAAISCIEEIDDIFLILIGNKESISSLLPSNMKLLEDKLASTVLSENIEPNSLVLVDVNEKKELNIVVDHSSIPLRELESVTA